MLTDPLSVECPACGAHPGEKCWGLRALGRGAYVAATPHKTRIALASPVSPPSTRPGCNPGNCAVPGCPGSCVFPTR